MKGMVFTEFLDMVEQTWSPDLADRLEIEVDGNGFRGELSADAAGIVATLFALGQLAAEAADPAKGTEGKVGTYLALVTDVAVSKSDNPDPVPAGQVLTYTITASNPAATSASRAYGVSITDTLPIGELAATVAEAQRIFDRAGYR